MFTYSPTASENSIALGWLTASVRLGNRRALSSSDLPVSRARPLLNSTTKAFVLVGQVGLDAHGMRKGDKIQVPSAIRV